MPGGVLKGVLLLSFRDELHRDVRSSPVFQEEADGKLE